MLVLASNSPRRKELLSLAGIPFTVRPAQLDESILVGESPPAYVRRMAESKAWAVQARMDGQFDSHAWVLAADTIVVHQVDILGKPETPQQAREILQRLRNCNHQVLTSLAVIRLVDCQMLSQVVVSDVTMRDYSDDEIEAYIASGDPMDKAGAYAIQHTGFHPVERVQGCYANVTGLPLCHLARMLQTMGVSALDTITQACQEHLNMPCPLYLQMVKETR
jgi:MAF protein